ncbi:YL1 nuclear protein [Fragilaria crotonensis]|nr:YL1 nuclear protein [Fragilaria crotonensis]
MSSSQSAVVERSRRLTAGKRMSSLVGEALDNDEAFGITRHGPKMARTLTASANQMKILTTRVVEKEGKIKGNRIFGDGVNAGLVLKFPPTLASLSSGAHPPSSATTAHADSLPATATVAAIPPALTALPPVKPVPSAKVVKCTLASTRPRRGKKALRTTTLAQSVSSEGGKLVGRAPATTSKRKQHRFTQEELLLEAATETEPENARWLLARKRLHQQEEATRAAMSTASAHTKLLQRYISKRGCFNTLNFSEMDAVPKILISNEADRPKAVTPTYCVITGKRVRYKDPKTKMGYYDLAAFKELRRRYDAGEPLQQGLVERKEAEVPCLKPETAVASQAPLVVQVAQVANGVALATPPNKNLQWKKCLCRNKASHLNAANRLPQEPLAAGQVKEHPPTATFAAKAPAPSDCKPQTIALFSSIETENNNREERTTTASTHAQDLTKPAVTDVPAKEKGTRRSRAAHSTGNRALTSATCVQSNAAVDVASIVVTATSATCKTLQSEPNEALSHGMESNLASAGCKPIATAAEAPVESMAQLPGEAPICDKKRAAAISTGPPDESASTPQTTKKARIMSPHTLVHTALTAYLELQAKAKDDI